ncbi:MAG: hypothetical protein AAFU61_18385, partial [Pseudomonadota bacterium]
NLPSMLHLGLLHLDADRLDEAQYFFNKARVSDPSNLDMMDHYALLLHLRGDVAELNRLAHDLLVAGEARPEPWVALSLHAESQGDRERALQYVEKATQGSGRASPATSRSWASRLSSATSPRRCSSSA